MNFSELESVVLALPEQARKVLASRLWDSFEIEEASSLASECTTREEHANAEPDGWSDADEFLEGLKLRVRDL